jgi:5-deoxy-glucuronate isomerase
MPQLKYQYQPAVGMQMVVSSDNSPLEYVSLRVLQLGPGDVYHGYSGDEEQAHVIISGTCNFDVNNQQWERIGGRINVFQERAYTVYVPSRATYTVTAITALEIAVGGAPSNRPGAATLITPDMLRYEKRGVWNWERHIYDVITSAFPVSQRLNIIEVLTPPGNWSSVPPHKHDADNPPYESKAEEIYFYKFKPEQGFGFQRVYNDDRSLDEVCLAEHNSVIIQPVGYHPVANHPGYQMYYLNIIAGEKPAVLPYDDPQHAWVKDVEQVIKGRGS